MENEQVQRTPFDRTAALEELERFGRDIERYRAQRKALGEEFETFIRSFDAPGEPGIVTDVKPAPAREAATATPAVVPGAPAAAALPTSTPVPASVPVPPPAPPVVAAEPAPLDPPVEASAVPAADIAPPPAAATAPVDPVSWSWVAPDVIGPDHVVEDRTADADAAAAFESPRAPESRTRSPLVIPAALAVGLFAIVAGVLMTRSGNREPESTPPAVVTAPAAAVPAPAPPAAAPPPAPVAAAPASASEISTIRRVWMRVIVDGARVVEREVPAGTTLPLNAEKTIVIRTGDAGAVRLTIRGQQPAFLGAEGEVVTRSFTVPPRAAAAGR